MPTRSNLIGKIFGFLTVIEFSFIRKGQTYWKCLCDCGKEVIVAAANLNRGSSQSCGCKKGYLISLKTGMDPSELAYHTLYNDYKSGAKIKHNDFDLTYESFKKIITDKCFYCGVPPKLSKTASNLLGKATVLYNGVDRKDNNLGYYIDNCVTACSDCNYAKKAKSYQDFMDWLNRIAEHHTNNILY